MTKTSDFIKSLLDDEDGTDTIRIERPAGACLCGCQLATSGDSRFRQGHDQRYRGVLLYAYRNQIGVDVVDGGMLISSDAMTLARNDGVEVSFTGGKVAGVAKRAAKPAPKVEPIESEPVEQDNNEFPLGQTVQVKVGRWTYTAEVIARSLILGDVCTLHYVTKNGAHKDLVKPTSEVLALLAEQG